MPYKSDTKTLLI